MSEPPTQNRNRSVVDYDTEEALRKALMSSDETTSKEGGETSREATMKQPQGKDWVLSSFDVATTEAQSMKEELHRLQVLKSYLILDAEREEAFERLTSLASHFYNVPIALVSLVDLGRQWFLSNRGLGDVRETPRRHAFCAHVILNKHSILIVKDASTDFRFKDNPLVTGPPHIRFYAGASLISPEGYKLGTFCIIDTKPRPNGLSEAEQAALRDLADMSVKELVDRRNKMKHEQSPAQLIAYTAHDLMTPLTGVQLSLSLLNEDEEVREKLSQHQLELLSTAANCSDLMIRICQTAIDTLRQDAAGADTGAQQMQQFSGSTKMSELVKSLSMIMEPIPKRVPLIITLNASVPPNILCDDLKLFRSALNLISNAVERTLAGAIHLKIFPREEEEKTHIMFECNDSGPDVEIEQYPFLFQPSRTTDGDLRLGLSSVATLIDSLDGEYGFRPLGMTLDGEEEPNRRPGSLFWFSVPLRLPNSSNHATTNGPSAQTGDKEAGEAAAAIRRSASHPIKMPIVPMLPRVPSLGQSVGSAVGGILRSGSASSIARSASNNSVGSKGMRKVPVIVGDVFQADALQNSCFRNVFEPVFKVDGKIPARLSNALSLESADKKMPAAPDKKSTATEKVPSAVVATLRSIRKKRALVIEDSLVVRKSLSRALDKLGFEVKQANDGMEGVDQLKETLFDLVLCDFLMPVMDGMDCVKQYRDWEKVHRPTFRQYIVGISAHATANDGGQGIKAGMDLFEPKPISVKTLTELQKGSVFVERSAQLDEIEGPLASDITEPKPSKPPPPEATTSTSPSAAAANDLVAKPVNQNKSEAEESSSNGGPPSSATAISASPLAEVSKKPVASELAASDESNRPPKRRKPSVEGLESITANNSKAPVCLIATNASGKNPSDISMEENGWKLVFVHDSQDCMHLLQMRNWDAILIDDDIPGLSGAICMEKFRAWEAQNRVNRQRNTFFICSVEIPSPFDKTSVVLPPNGFDVALSKPVQWKDLDHYLKQTKNRSLEIVTRR